MKVLMEADVHEEQEGTVLLRLKTGFGDPELRVDRPRVETLEARREKMKALFHELPKSGQGLCLFQEQAILKILDEA